MYNLIKNKLKLLSPRGYDFLDGKKVFVKYVLSGGTAAGVDLGLLFLFTEFFRLHYIFSACLAFAIAIGVSFSLQKFWTFRDDNNEIAGQMVVYVVVGLINLGINAFLMYLLVDKFAVYYILAQIMVGGVVAVWSFLVYRVFIFK